MTSVTVSSELLRKAACVLEAGVSEYATSLARDLRAAAGEALEATRRETFDLSTLVAA
jgi:hypothetical protein